MTAQKNKVLVIGLDGATFDLLVPWIEQGRLPNLGKIYRNGCHGNLRSTMQPMSPQAWVSFQTGMNPGKHGVYDFQETRLDQKATPISSASVAANTWWEILSNNGKGVILLNVLGTYPPKEIEGAIVAGRLTPPGRTYTFPASLTQEIEEKTGGYIIEVVKQYKGASTATTVLEQFAKMVEQRTKVALHLMDRYEWDAMAAVFTVVDSIQHIFWSHLDPEHPHYDPDVSPHLQQQIIQLYEQIDESVGKLTARAGDETNVLIISDHGFGPLYKSVNLNRWLAEEGFLTIKKPELRKTTNWHDLVGWGKRVAQHVLPQRVYRAVRRRTPRKLKRAELKLYQVMSISWEQSRAYALGRYGCIYVNLKGRDPVGVVDPGAEYEETCREITDALMNWENPFTGRKMVARVHTKEDVYNGPNMKYAPDLLIEWEDYAYMTTKAGDLSQNFVFYDQWHNSIDLPMTGIHRMDGVFLADGPTIKSGAYLESANIIDIAPTLLHLMGFPIPDNMDGKVLENALSEEFMSSHPITFTPGELISTPDGASSYTTDDIAAVEERLKDLGYL